MKECAKLPPMPDRNGKLQPPIHECCAYRGQATCLATIYKAKCSKYSFPKSYYECLMVSEGAKCSERY